MKILFTNDDGIQSQGLLYLVKEFAKDHEVYVSAPMTQKSACSASLSVHRSFCFEEIPVEGAKRAFAVGGTPVDCVKFAITYFHLQPDVVISGPNFGWNLGTDINYSGTVGAALEAGMMGYPAIAISCKAKAYCYDAAYEFLQGALDKLLQKKMPYLVWNINLPEVSSLRETKGVILTSQGFHPYEYEYCREEDGSFRLCGTGQENAMPCDVYYCKHGYITVTPLSFDLTRYDVLREWTWETLE